MSANSIHYNYRCSLINPTLIHTLVDETAVVPSSGRCTMATPPLNTACGTELRPRRAPHPRGPSSRHIPSSGHSAAAGSSAAARGLRLRYMAPERAAKLGNCHKIGNESSS
jgi:hypothetical protein